MKNFKIFAALLLLAAITACKKNNDGDTTTCAAPTLPTVTAITGTSALLNWTETDKPSQWQIKYGIKGFNVNTAGTSILTSTKPYALNPPLMRATAYDYYVRAICGVGDTSAWSPVTNFTTSSNPVNCAAPTMPTATAITTTKALLNWQQVGTPTQWEIKYGASGFNVNTTGTSIVTSSKPYTLNPPLKSATTYDYYIRAICGAGDPSDWSVVATFTTQ
mgnify:FL=1